MQNALRLKAGDILIFGKTREGELLLGGRARTASDKDRKAPPRTRKTTEEKQVIKSEHGSLPLLGDADIGCIVRRSCRCNRAMRTHAAARPLKQRSRPQFAALPDGFCQFASTF